MANIEDAILAINPSAEFSCNPADSTAGITWIVGDLISAEDLEAKKAELQVAEDAAVVQKATTKASGNTKLLGLGLTQAEATAMTGYTPE